MKSPTYLAIDTPSVLNFPLCAKGHAVILTTLKLHNVTRHVPPLSSKCYEHITARGTEDGSIGSGIIGDRDVIYGNMDDAAFFDHANEVILDFSTSNEDAGETPAAFTILARDLGIAFQDIGYRKEDVFQYDFAKDFWFGGAGGDSKEKIFIHKADSGEAAKALYDLIVEEHQWDYEVLDQNETDALYTHEFLKTFNSVNSIGVYVFGVEGMPDKNSAVGKIDALRKMLEAS